MSTKRSFVAVVAALVAMTVAQPAADAAATTPGQTGPAGTNIALPDEVIDALERDLGLSQAEVHTRLANEARSADTAEDLEASLGRAFAGAWFERGDASLTVAVTDASQADEVRAAGAQPEVVDHSQAQLDAVQRSLDRHEAAAPISVVGWHMDVATNQVVVLTQPGTARAADAFVDATGVDADAVDVDTTTQQPRLLFDVRGGDAYFTPQFRCSIGFSVRGGYTTAGHCGTPGTPTSGFNRVSQGTFRGSVFPGSDHAWVQVNSNWTPRPWVNNYRGGNVIVRGSQEAPIGASVCRSGSTTGWRCGTLQAKNQTVRYPQGTVFGLTRTSACAEGGDSGGSFLWGNQAQGMTSGGSGNCTFGGTIFFQPVNPALQRYGLTLVTG